MNLYCLIILDWFFICFHSMIILFSLTGWYFKRTWLPHLLLMILITISWFGLGIFYGPGYCFLTEWHWQVRYKLGFYNMPASYTKFLFDLITGLDSNARLIDIATVVGYLFAMIMALKNTYQLINKQ